MSAKVIVLPDQVQKVLGEGATRQLVDTMNEIAATNSASKIDKAEYDAHGRLIASQFEAQNRIFEEKFARIDERFERFKVEVNASIRGALLTGLAWMTVLIAGLFGALYAFVK